MNIFSAPLYLRLGITNKCNLCCRYCLVANTRSNPDLTTKKLLDIIRQIKELKIFSVNISGGEPLMRKDFFTILKSLEKSKIEIVLSTNGTLINRDISKRLTDSRVKFYKVSLDGSSKDIQDQIRGRGSFDKAIEGIKNLVSRKCNVVISTTIARFNYKDIKNILLLVRDIGAQKIIFNDVLYKGNALCYNKSLKLKAKEKSELLDMIGRLRDRFGEFITGSMVRYLDVMKTIKDKPKEIYPLRIYGCFGGTIKCTIRPDGWVTPCELRQDVKAGDLKKESLYNIWHHSRVMKEFRKTIVIQKKDISGCCDCRYLKLCMMIYRCIPFYQSKEGFNQKKFYCWNEY